MADTTTKIAVIGANGQVGSALRQCLGEGEAIFFGRKELDLEQPDTIENILSQHRLHAVINAAAYTAVDKAEEEQERAMQVNGHSVGILANFCQSQNIPLIHYSTDYVFNGTGTVAWQPSDPTDPVNYYGQSKLAGEQAIIASGADYLIFRTSWVYDAYHHNFFNTMLKLAKEKEELSIVDDQIGVPSYAPDIAKATINALNLATSCDAFPSGVYHLCNRGETNWYEYAKTIFMIAERNHIPLAIKKVKAVPSTAYKTPAKRPLNSRLDCKLTKSKLKVIMPDWHESLERCFEEIL